MNRSLLLTIMIAASTIIIGCHDDTVEEVDKDVPAIEISEPIRNTVYAPGDTVFIHAKVSDNVALRKVSVHIHDQFLVSPADTVFSYRFSISNAATEIDTFWIVNHPGDRNYTIYFESTDRSENYAKALRYFYQFH